MCAHILAARGVFLLAPARWPAGSNGLTTAVRSQLSGSTTRTDESKTVENGPQWHDVCGSTCRAWKSKKTTKLLCNKASDLDPKIDAGCKKSFPAPAVYGAGAPNGCHYMPTHRPMQPACAIVRVAVMPEHLRPCSVTMPPLLTGCHHAAQTKPLRSMMWSDDNLYLTNFRIKVHQWLQSHPGRFSNAKQNRPVRSYTSNKAYRAKYAGKNKPHRAAGSIVPCAQKRPNFVMPTPKSPLDKRPEKKTPWSCQ